MAFRVSVRGGRNGVRREAGGARGFVAALALAGLTGVTGSALASGICHTWGSGVQVGTMNDPSLSEASGLVASQINPGIFWAHNDSGNPAELIAFQADGTVVAVLNVQGALNIDWEDLALGPCPESCACLFIADMGDNLNVRGTKTIYRVPEPVLGDGLTETDPATALDFEYPDGRPDAETLLVDPRTGDIYVVTKVDTGLSSVYRFPSSNSSSAVTLEKVAELQLEGTSSGSLLATGGDVASDGGRLVIRALDHAQEYPIPQGMPLESAFDHTRTLIPLPASSQGEAIAYMPDGMSLMTISENLPAPIQEVPCQDGVAITEPVLELSEACVPDNSGCSASRQVPVSGAFLGVGLGALAMIRRRRVR